jgi:hypothetical protein
MNIDDSQFLHSEDLEADNRGQANDRLPHVVRRKP